MINEIKPNLTPISNNTSKSKQNTKNVEPTQTQETNGVILEIGSTPNKSVTYSKPAQQKADVDEISRLWEETEKATESIRNLVEELIARQGKDSKLIKAGKEPLVIDDEAKAKAEEAISEDGEFGVKAVSDRIVAFAKAVSGNDKSKLEEIKAAIDQGFKEAEKALGGELPDISKKTYDEIMTKLDGWNEEE